jgi:uncharacterized protein (TIGR01777 family)
MTAKVLVPGGSGSIGRLLCDFLTEKGYEVSVLSRRKSTSSKYKTYLWNYKENFIEEEAILNCDYVIHMAGAGIADKRWTSERKKEIIDSRVKTSALLFKTLSNHKNKVKCFISASGAGYYGQLTSDKIFAETDLPGSDFIGQTCKQWEAAVNQIKTLNIRTVNLRIGMVLMKNGGAIEKMTKPFQLGLGSVLGNGNQIIPWIQANDLQRIILQAMVNKNMHGPYNCCSPETTNNLEFTKTLAITLHKKLWLPHAPVWILKIILGQRSTLLTEGSKLSTKRLLSTGFAFNYPGLQDALSEILA